MRLGESRLAFAPRILAAAAGFAVFGLALSATAPPAPPRIVVRAVALSDAPGSGIPPLPAGQDGDGFPDTDEAVDLTVRLSNKSNVDFTNVVLHLSTIDSRVACISSATVPFGSLGGNADANANAPFRFRVAPTADRGGATPPAACSGGVCSNGAGACLVPGDCARSATASYAARLMVTITADQLPAGGMPLPLDVELDLDATTTPMSTTTFAEGFESGFGTFALQNLDQNRATNALSDGYRCQYNDPDFPGSSTYGDTACYLGFQAGQSPANDWHVEQTSTAGGGRARFGSRSLHWGFDPPTPDDSAAHRLSQLDAVRSTAVRLAARVCSADPSTNPRACDTAADCATVGGGPCVPAASVLSFAQQVSMLDDRYTPSRPRTSPDRGVVQATVEGSGIWRKLEPFENIHDVQVNDQFTNCTFDPVDDGNDEDDFFSPADPDRRYGPSSTCAPEWAFSYLGDTDRPFSAAAIGRASDGPGLSGSLGIGTWVETKYDLASFRGRLIRVRWLATSIKVNDIQTASGLYLGGGYQYDDGWYIDDVRITQTLPTSAATAALDAADRSALPVCGAACASLVAALAVDPPAAVPGAPVRLDADGSMAAACPNGGLAFQFGVDGDGDGSLGGTADWFLDGSTPASEITVAPRRSASYGVRVRCASDPACFGDETAPFTASCPLPQTFDPEAWWASMRLENWSHYQNPSTDELYPDFHFVTNDAGQVGDVAYGYLSSLRATGSFQGFDCTWRQGPLKYATTGFSDPPLNDGYWYLIRGSEPTCNEPQSFRTFHPKENPGDPGKRDREVTVCN